MRKQTSQFSPWGITILSFAILCVVVLLVLAIGLFWLNSQMGEDFVESNLTEVIGQEVQIASMHINIGHPIRLRLKEASVANPPWASASFLASIELLELDIDAYELLGGNLVFTNIHATKPLIHLEQSTQGKANWTAANVAHSSPDGQPTRNQREEDQQEQEDGQATKLPRIESISIDNGHLTYDDPNTNTMLHLSFGSRNHETSIENDSLIANGGGIVFGQPIKINLSVGPPGEETEKNKIGYPLDLKLNSVDTHLHVKGTLDALVSPETANLQITLEGQQLSRWNEAFNTELPTVPPYQLSGGVQLTEGVWSLNPVNVAVGDSDLTGTLEIIPGDEPYINGNFSSERLDILQLQGYMATKQESDPLAQQVAGYLYLLSNAEGQGNFRYGADQIVTEDSTIQDVEIALTLKEATLTLKTLSGAVGGTHVHAEGHVSMAEDQAEGRLKFRLEAEQATKVTTADAHSTETTSFLGIPGRLSGELAVEAVLNHEHEPVKEDQTHTAEGNRPPDRATLESVAIQEFQLQYADPSSSTNIIARLVEGVPGQTMHIKADGEYQTKPMEFTLILPSLESLTLASADSKSAQRISADFKLAEATASVRGALLPLWPPTHMNFRFLAKSDKAAITADVLGIDLPTLGEVSIEGSVSKHRSTWSINELDAQFGKSHVQGSGTIKTTDDARFEIALDSKVLDVTPWFPTSGEANADRMTGESAPSDVHPSASNSSESSSAEFSIPAWLTNLHGAVSIHVQQLVLPDARLKDVTMDATIHDGLLRIAPLSLALGGGTIKLTSQLNLAAPFLTGSLKTLVERVAIDEAMKTFSRDAAEMGKVSGLIALRLPSPRAGTEETFNLDALLERLRIEEVRLRYDDPALEAKTDLRLKAESLSSGAKIIGTVEYRNKPVDVSISTGSLRQAMQDYQALPVEAAFQIDKTTIGIDSTIGKLLPLKNFNGKVRVEGQDLVRLGEFLEIPLPHLPPYRLHAQLLREQGPAKKQTFNFENLDGTIGDSDVAGTLRVTTGGERPLMLLHLRSDKLDLDDLAGLVGAPPDPEETASAKQKAQAQASEERETLLPNKPMDFTKLRQMDANVEYRAKRVQAPKLPLDDFLLDMILEDGHVRIDRLDFGVAGGTMTMELGVNAQKEPVQAKLITEFAEVNLNDLFAQFEMGDDSFGNIGGRATLWMQGESMARWFASADGGLYLTMAGGQIDALLIELAGLDFTESAAVFIGTDTGVKIECAYTDLQARSGIVTIQPFLLDTNDTKFKGFGEIDLRQEQLDLTVHPYPKDFTLLSSRGPLHITGTLKNPDFSVDPSFPFPEFGTAEDSERCLGMDKALKNVSKAKRKNDGQENPIESVK